MQQFLNSEVFMVEDRCLDCGKLVKHKVTGYILNCSYGVAPSVRCDECQKKEERKEKVEREYFEKNHPEIDCPSCHGKGEIDGFKCALCFGTGKKRKY